MQTDEDEEDDGTGVKRSKSSLMSDEERKKRRQEINRQSARRIRERRTQEMEGLRVQVCLPVLVLHTACCSSYKRLCLVLQMLTACRGKACASAVMAAAA